jgi:replication initiation protein RepC
MQHVSNTPFGPRQVTPEMMAYSQMAEAPCPVPVVDKWTIFNDLRTARAAFGVTDRDLSVLYALMTFLPEREMASEGDLIVFPSNETLSERAHGMAESTLRRHLAALVAAGLILRHDSPNGKRYAARGAGGEVLRAFGFSLRPLLVRVSEITEAAAEADQRARELRMTRELAVLRIRDAAKLLEYVVAEGSPAPLEELQAMLAHLRRALRRRMDMSAAQSLSAEAEGLLARVSALIETPGTAVSEKMNGKDDHSERHYHNSNTDVLESELSVETTQGADRSSQKTDVQPGRTVPQLPLALVVKACPDLLTFSRREIRTWDDLVSASSSLTAMLGISSHAWKEAADTMGSEVAAICVAAILQRVNDIRSPGGYLRALSRKAETGVFSPGPMIMSLISASNSKAI